MPMQPRSSPLAIQTHEFTAVELQASPTPHPKSELQLSTEVHTVVNEDDLLQWLCELTVRFGSADEEKPAPYSGGITAVGQFYIAEDYPQDRHVQLIEVTAASILYGACREMLANLTARSSHGLLSLPSVSFFDPSATDAKKTAKKTTRKAAKKRRP